MFAKGTLKKRKEMTSLKRGKSNQLDCTKDGRSKDWRDGNLTHCCSPSTRTTRQHQGRAAVRGKARVLPTVPRSWGPAPCPASGNSKQSRMSPLHPDHSRALRTPRGGMAGSLCTSENQRPHGLLNCKAAAADSWDRQEAAPLWSPLPRAALLL